MDLEKTISQFAIEGELIKVVTHKNGHINDTYLSTWRTPQGAVNYIHQRINHKVFTRVPQMMENIVRVTSHIADKIRECGNPEDRTLKVIPGKSGQSYVKTDDDGYWRTYDYVGNSESYDVCKGPDQAREAARSLGRFQSYLLDLSTAGLHESIPNFLSSPYRFEVLNAAIKKDAVNRCIKAKAEIDFALGLEGEAATIANHIKRGTIPERVTHNDMKLNNVLFSKTTGRGICVVDLDVCMPGYSLFDFGDLVRNTSVPVAEDETDLRKVYIDKRCFAAIVEGYLEEAGHFLNSLEIELLSFAPRLLALTLGVRFLSDYLSDDIYFRIKHKEHNLDRARTQFQIVRSMQESESEMREIVKKIARL